VRGQEVVNLVTRIASQFCIESIEMMPAGRIGVDLVLKVLPRSPQCLDHLFNLDHTHVFTASWLWELPVRFDQRSVNALIGGWNLTGILAIQTGYPFTVTSGVDNARTGTGGQRPDQLKDWRLPDDRSRGEKVLLWFDPTAFVVNALGTYGTVGRNSLRGPGSTTLNLGLHKDFPIRESLKVQFRFETFNALNNVNLGLPNGNRSSNTFGRITTAGDPRILQFALRVVF